MRMVAIKLFPGQDLKEAIISTVKELGINAASVLGCVGALSQACMRMAGATPESEEVREYNQPLEIISLIGNVGPGRVHLHLAVADVEGKVFGGHLKEGCIVDITAELILGVEDSLRFTEKFDKSVGFGNLNIEKIDEPT